MLRPLNKNGFDLIKGFEGFEAKPYRDVAGIWTIGYGAIYGLDGRRVTDGHTSITRQQGEALLERDTRVAREAVQRLITWPLDDNQFAALVSFTFNLGSGSLKLSTLRRVINRGDMDEVHNQFMRWIYAGGKRVSGLARRRRIESLIFSGNFSQVLLDQLLLG